MFLISLLFIGLVSITIITEQEYSIFEQEELVPIPVRTKTKG